MSNFYVEVAREKFARDSDIDVLDIVDTSPEGGAWVTVLVWIDDPTAPAPAGDPQ